MIESDFRDASLPLFAAGEVEVVEWSFDMGWDDDPLPAWVGPLIDLYAQQGRLLGHGVTFSTLSGHWLPQQERWLGELESECSQRAYRHISEHFGFMVGGSFHRGPPLPVPMTAGSLRVGRDRLRRLADVSGRPVGLENLAFAFGIEDVRRQGEFLEMLLAPVHGLLVLDLHNIHCQCHNFQLAPEQLLASYPLERVRELHVSGGSWSQSTAVPGRVRRDTHDGPVPEEVFELLALALRICPRAEAVILERMGGTIRSETDAARFRGDFRRMAEVVWERHHVPA